MWFKNPPPPPPVPAGVREMLKDYPEIIQDLQDGLDRLVSEMAGKPNATPPFERVIWLLKDSLEADYINASKELRAAEASGDPLVIERAKKKELQVDLAGRRGTMNLKELRDYFDQYGEAFK